MIRRRWYRPVMAGATMLILVAAAGVALATFRAYERAGAFGIDKITHDEFVARWLETGSMYLPAQLLGPVNMTPSPHIPAIVPSMYPPTTVLLFAPFAFLPDILWWIVPLGIVGLALARWRPAPWTWPVLAAVLLYPPVWSNTWAGNTLIWVLAGLAAGLTWGWPGPLLLLKPSVAPLALAGSWRRSWWVGLAAVMLVSIAFLDQWAAYFTVLQRSSVNLDYGFPGFPIYLGILLGYQGRTRGRQPAPAMVEAPVPAVAQPPSG